MADFKLFFPKLMGHEGGYVDHPADPGAETYGGVARAYNPQWAGWALVDAAKKKLGLHSPVPAASYPALNKALAAEPTMKATLSNFYERLYWDALHLDSVSSQALAEQLADHAASAGTARPPRMIQFAANQVAGKPLLVVDGQLGPKTLAAINSLDQTKLLRAFVELRRAFYRYRAGVATPAADVLALLKSLNLRPDAASKVFLNSWLARLPNV